MANSTDSKKAKSGTSDASDRDARLRKALRENLNKRKAQARGRTVSQPSKPKSAS